jgi:hypothetical protein
MEELYEPPDEAYNDECSPAEIPYSVACADACSAIVDSIANVERGAARQRAWQVEMIDDARRMAEATEHGLLTVGSTLSAAKRYEMVRRNLVAEIACAVRMPEITVDRMLTVSEALMSRLPLTMDALRAGDISYRHAEIMVDQAKTLPDDIALELENAALSHAQTLTPSKFRAKAVVIRERLDPESMVERVLRSSDDRRLDFVPADDGMAWLNLYTTAPEATSIFTAVRDYARGLQHPSDPRTLTQITADVYTDALAAALSGEAGEYKAGSPGPREAGEVPARWHEFFAAQGATPTKEPVDRFGCAFGRIRPTVTVTVPAFTLLGITDESATLEGYGPIDAETARELAGQSNTWYRLLTDPSTGVPISLDSTKYRPSKAMKRFLRYRDGTCRFPGCNRAAKHCDIDHTRAAEFGGPTECDNLSHLCRKHHRLKHQTTWQVTQTGAGRLEWTSPGNRTYATEPAVLFPPGQSTSAPVSPGAVGSLADPQVVATDDTRPLFGPDDPAPF